MAVIVLVILNKRCWFYLAVLRIAILMAVYFVLIKIIEFTCCLWRGELIYTFNVMSFKILRDLDYAKTLKSQKSLRAEFDYCGQLSNVSWKIWFPKYVKHDKLCTLSFISRTRYSSNSWLYLDLILASHILEMQTAVLSKWEGITERQWKKPRKCNLPLT